MKKNTQTDQCWPPGFYDIACTDCPRLAEFRAVNQIKYPDFFNAPLPPFGDPDAELLIVGLAPGLKGANRTGRPFTGDFCGDLLYSTLHKHGFASSPHSEAVGDGLQLRNARVSNAVKCVPPENKPTPGEIRQCNHFLSAELQATRPRVLLALGVIAHQAVLKAYGLKQSSYKFAHGAQHSLEGAHLFDSYHVSRYNTQTGRLTPAMFDEVLSAIADFLKKGS